MKEKEGIRKNNIKDPRRHPISQRLVAALLCICLSMLSLPMDDYETLVLAAQGKEILSFPALPEEIREQEVEKGTPQENLILPDTLKAVCRFSQDSLQETGKESTGTTGDYGALSEDSAEILGDTVPSEETFCSSEDSGLSKEVPEEPEETTEPELVPEEEVPELPKEPSEPEEPAISEEDQIETVSIEGVVWESQPQYDGNTAGTYVFTPKLPEAYVLADGAGLPEIYVRVEAYVNRREEDTEVGKREKEMDSDQIQPVDLEDLEKDLEEDTEDPPLEEIPGCGVITQNTTWTQEGHLIDGELVVNPGVTLTINKTVTVQGNVTIKGGGNIVRGKSGAAFHINDATTLTLDDIVLDGASVTSSSAFLNVAGGEVIMNAANKIQNCVSIGSTGGAFQLDSASIIMNGAVIKNCSSDYGGAFYTKATDSTITLNNASILDCRADSRGGAIYADDSGRNNKIFLNNARIENCVAGYTGGGIYATNADVTINGGTYQNNSTNQEGKYLGFEGGGFVFICKGDLTINSGNFIGNTTNTKGGCIHHCGHSGTKTNLKGGYFQGNTSSSEEYQGSGGVYNSTVVTGDTFMTLSGDVQFRGDGTSSSGTDGIYLDSVANTFRKIQISDTLTYPVNLFLKAIKDYAIAEGVSGYLLLKERDMKKINFFDVTKPPGIWYAELDSESNEVKITDIKPEYGYYIYYVKNGAQGASVIDDNSYQAGDTAIVKSPGDLSLDGCLFKEWNSKSDGTGMGYQPGDELTVQGDTDLFAIFYGKNALEANFYSGSAGNKEVKSVEVLQPATSGTITAPELKPMEEDGWNPVGWEEDISGYAGEISAGTALTLTSNKDYYGVYKKEATISYVAEGASGFPRDEIKYCYANVHKQVTKKPAEFTILGEAKRPGYTFHGWNTKPDGTGDSYQEGSLREMDENLTLYAIYERNLSASFYSGKDCKKEVKNTSIGGTVTAPELIAMDGWTSVGWDENPSGYAGEIPAGAALTLTNDVSYYGVYKKAVTLSYQANGAESFPKPEKKYNFANVSNKVTIDLAEFRVGQAPVRPGYVFSGWNTKPDGTGENYWEGDTLAIEEDMTLYAVFQKYVTANFYSGKAGNKETKSAEVAKNAVSVAITSPKLAEMKGWEPVGWDLDPEGYDGDTGADIQVKLTRDTDYYGVYKKEVMLTYEAKGTEDILEQQNGECRANVHKDVTTIPARFIIAPPAVRAGSAFAGWNTKADGTGIMYLPGDSLKTLEDVTLYAVYQKTIIADFYSGAAGRKETKAVSIEDGAVSGIVTAPELAELEGWNPMGWDTESDRYDAAIQAGEGITLERNASFYGVYHKNVTVSYQGNGADTALEGETKECRANVHQEISYDMPGFLLAQAPQIPGYRFCGWNTSPAGTGKSYQAGSWQEFEEDITLYACWEAQEASYQVEHYKQELEGGSYTLEETEHLMGLTDSTATAIAKVYEGFSENPSHGSGKSTGKVTADGGLTLKLFYDRNAYQVSFDLNGGEGDIPEAQEVRYGGFLEPVVEPKRSGYTFYGWYMDQAGTAESQWDFGKSVEENTASPEVTLYAKWVDDIAPALEKASFGKGYKNLFHWLISQKGMKITVPIIEEGSGVKEAYYTLMPDEDTETEPKGVRTSKTYQDSAGIVLAAGSTKGVVQAAGRTLGVIQAGNDTVRAADSSRKQSRKAKIKTENGKTAAEFTIDPDFKGQISMVCTDNAGNESARTLLTAKDGGIILENHAPRITFTVREIIEASDTATIDVLVTDTPQEEITGGLAEISYRVDGGTAMILPAEEIHNQFVQEYRFSVELQGEGKHTLRVNAKDHAGNRETRETSLEIVQNQQPAPEAGEPKTGENIRVQIYATISMIAGFTYLLLYFKTREHGMTEQKKDELVSRLVNWAKSSGGIRRLLALAAIFLLLAYYHSIGKNVSERWKEVCEK